MVTRPTGPASAQDVKALGERWSKMLAQAQGFAVADDPQQGWVRASQALDEIERALASAGPELRPELQDYHTFAAEAVRRYAGERAAWRNEVEARQDAYVAREKRDYASSPRGEALPLRPKP